MKDEPAKQWLKNPCKKDCPNRSATCHGKCESYLAFQKERRDISKQRETYMSGQYYTIHRKMTRAKKTTNDIFRKPKGGK